MKSALIASSYFLFLFFLLKISWLTFQHSVSHQNSPRHELHISFSCCCFCFASLSLYFRLNWQQLLSLPLLNLLFFSFLCSCLLCSLASLPALLLSSVCPGKVFIYSHSVALFYPCCASLCQVEKSHFRHLQRHLHGRPIHVPCTPPSLPLPLSFLSHTVFYLRFSSLSSSWSPNLLAAAAAARKAASCCCCCGCCCFCLLSQNYVAKSSQTWPSRPAWPAI